MPRSLLLRLHDIQEAIDGVQELVSDADYGAFIQNWGMQRAVERALEIISEASRYIPSDLRAQEPRIPWRQIAAIGNLLRHEYQRVDTKSTWNVVHERLPPLAAAIARLIAAAEPCERT